jgi:N-carbamoyl-L-amino-acid hydrolase
MSLTNAGIDGGRLLADLYRLREFGTYLTGVHRPTLSAVDMQARHWLCERMRDAGLEPEIDGIGNVIGRGRGEGPRVRLEVARTMTEQRGGGVDVAAWADEEGHFGSFLGSRSFVGDVSEADIDAARNRYTDQTLRQALADAGLAGRPRAQVEPGRYLGYREAHIEQGDALEAAGLRIGVVTGIVGNWTFRVSFVGVQNHAGTTRMAIRKDAGVALVRFAASIERRFPEIAGPRSVWTVGRITLSPGSPSIVPGAAEMIFQFRDVDPGILDALHAALDDLVAEANEGPCEVTLEVLSCTIPKQMDPGFQDALERAAARLAPGMHQRMPSGAGHDAQQLARVMPSAMLFVPSIGGISHHVAENTSDEDIVLGCEVLAAAVGEILAGA